MKNLNHYVAIYKAQLNQGDIYIAYTHLVKYVMKLRVHMMKRFVDQFTFTGMLHGYMDYTYFYYTNDFLKSKKLKLGLVLNHREMRFEIWLLGNTQKIQRAYWEILKTSKWNKNRTDIPTYSILEAIIEAEPDFDQLPQLTTKIESQFIQESEDILRVLRTLA
ncbi:MAG: hypothetical protein HRU40_06170 [Saprospiraceae bacterium]|nr:hypothetical protein [Saprospiraceae bacterium]